MSSVSHLILAAAKKPHEGMKRCGNYRKSARPRKQLFLDKKMDPVKKEVHILTGPIHLLAEDQGRVIGIPLCLFGKSYEKGQEIEIRTV